MSNHSLMRREITEDAERDEGGIRPPQQVKWLREAVATCRTQDVAAAILGVSRSRLTDWLSGARTFSFNAVIPLLRAEPEAAEAWVNAQAADFGLLPTRQRPDLSPRAVRRRAISLLREHPEVLRKLTDEFEETTDVIRLSLEDSGTDLG
jgi:hypothetical protein